MYQSSRESRHTKAPHRLRISCGCYGLPSAYTDPLAIEIDREFPPVVRLPNLDASFDGRKVGMAGHGTYMLHEEVYATVPFSTN